MSGGVGNVLGAFGENSFLLLLLLFILLASCITWGRESNFFFIIILAVIAFGGFGRTFFGEGVF
ncbi:MAG: hypothetical protein GX201_04795 [Clostridiales bacterium]|nr:hypothetical protein [Clostridiales bacterium]